MGRWVTKEVWWVSSYNTVTQAVITAQVVTADKVITDAAPILNKFIGQPFTNLKEWMHNTQGGLQVRRLHVWFSVE